MQPTLLMLALMAWNPERSVTVCVESRVPTLLAEKGRVADLRRDRLDAELGAEPPRAD